LIAFYYFSLCIFFDIFTEVWINKVAVRSKNKKNQLLTIIGRISKLEAKKDPAISARVDKDSKKPRISPSSLNDDLSINS